VLTAERAVELDPTHVPSLVLRAELAVSNLDVEDVMRQARRLEGADTANTLVHGALQGLRCLLASDEEFEAALLALRNVPTEQWHTAFRFVQMARPDRAEVLVDQLQQTAGPGNPSRLARWLKFRLLLAGGRLAEVDSALEAGVFDEGELRRTLERSIVAASLAGIADPNLAERSVASLTQSIPTESALALFAELPDVIQTGWAVAAFYATRGDTMTALEWRETFGSMPAGGAQPDYRGSLQADLDSRLAVRRGQIDLALQHATTAFDLWGIHTDNVSEDWPEPAMRFHLAELLLDTNRPDSAAAILESMVPPASWLGFYVAQSSLILGELAEAAGDLDTAERHYHFAWRLWESGDQSVRTFRDRAREGMRRVTGTHD
jgi:hypothetical protein